MNAYDLTGRTAVVTGGARGIGQAIAVRLLASGANVMIWDVDKATLEAAPAALDGGDKVDTALADVTDPDAVEAAHARTLERFGGIDVLVNDAGISGPTVPTWRTRSRTGTASSRSTSPVLSYAARWWYRE